MRCIVEKLYGELFRQKAVNRKTTMYQAGIYTEVNV